MAKAVLDLIPQLDLTPHFFRPERRNCAGFEWCRISELWVCLSDVKGETRKERVSGMFGDSPALFIPDECRSVWVSWQPVFVSGLLMMCLNLCLEYEFDLFQMEMEDCEVYLLWWLTETFKNGSKFNEDLIPFVQFHLWFLFWKFCLVFFTNNFIH